MTDSTPTRRILHGDNGKTLALVPDASIDMIYMDPPFGSDREYTGKHGRGFSDVWSWGEQEKRAYNGLRGNIAAGVEPTNPVLDGVEYNVLGDKQVHAAVLLATEFALASDDERFVAYVLHMGVRLAQYKRVLKSTGNLVIHCDQTASHIIKAMVDAAFGRKNFRNEIIWKRNVFNKTTSKNLPRNHDVILVWGKSKNAFFDSDSARLVGEMPAENAARYGYNDGDGRGNYSADSMFQAGITAGESSMEWRGVDPKRQGQGGHWVVSREARKELSIEHLGTLDALEELDKAGYIYWTSGGVPRIKRYIRWHKGMPMDDIWVDIAALSSNEAERLGYPTQKPVALLDRLIRLYSPENGHVLDPFGGCGTTADAAERLGRSWTVCDISIHAIDVIDRRMSDAHGIGEKHGLTIEGDWPGSDLVKIKALPEPERRRYLSRLVGAASLDTDRTGDATQLDRGIHGHFSIKDGTTKPPHGILMIAPTGGNVTDVEVLKRLRREDGALFGVLICDVVTDAMRAEAVKAGTWTTPGTYVHEKVTVDAIQFITVAEVVARGVESTLPSGVRLNLPYVPAKKREATLPGFAA